MNWCYGLLKECNCLKIAEIYFNDEGKAEGGCDNFGDDEQLNFDLILDDLKKADRYFELDEETEELKTIMFKVK
jgi:hypothetical protein